MKLKQIIIITILFSALDYFMHLYGMLPNVPHTYYLNKIIVTPIILYFLLKNTKWNIKIISFITATLLQVVYFTQYAYTLQENIKMIVLHTIVLYISAYLFDKFMKRIGD